MAEIGYKQSEEHKHKVSLIKKGISPSRLAIENSANIRRGKLRSEETKRKISLALKGKPNGLKGRKLSEEHRTKLRNYKPSLETKERISNSMLGHLVSEETKHKIGLIHKGTHHSEEIKLKISKACKGRHIGFKHTEQAKSKISLSHGGTGIPYENSEYPLEFDLIRWDIRQRDNYTCQKCFHLGNIVHHKDRNKQNNNLDNLVTLCRKCHATIHGGRIKCLK